MNALYRTLDTSRQAFHQRLDRFCAQREREQQLLPVLYQIREDHPRMAARRIYHMLAPCGMGRDRFERFCFAHGFKVERVRSFRRTTDSTGVVRFDNLLVGLELTSVNRVFVSDITYYQLEERFYYLTLVMDLYSHLIVGYAASESLHTTATTLPALRMALSNRNVEPGLIFHSDGGGQYYCKDFIKLTATYKIRNSMSETVFDNATAERLNGIIKNDYLLGYAPKTFTELKAALKRAVTVYNGERPHDSLCKLTPVAFEQLCTEEQLANKRKKEAKKEKDNNKNNNHTKFKHR